MPFQFKIEDVAEIHRDPDGHYHHWTILIGRLIEGTVQRGAVIKVPFQDGTVLIAHMLDFIAYGRSLGSEVSAGQFDHSFGLIVWQPAPQGASVALDIAVDASEADFARNMIETLENHPERIFHNRGKYAPYNDCWQCTQPVNNIPEAKSMLERLQTIENVYIAQRAARLTHRIQQK